MRNMKDREQECFIALQKTLAVVVVVWIYAQTVMLNYRHGLRQKARCRMQIVIDIPEEEYQTYINHTEAILDASIPLVHQDLLGAVINGIPLPKGHGRLIDADDLFDNTCIDEIPTIIEADKAGEEE